MSIPKQSILIMTSIDDLILQSTNPFDNYLSKNFWHSQVATEPVVESIHTEVIAAVTETSIKLLKIVILARYCCKAIRVQVKFTY